MTISIIVSIIMVVYVLGVVMYAQKQITAIEVLQEEQSQEYRQQFQKLVSQKDLLFNEKMDIENEALKIFTLYEMTKEITKSLSEEEAFQIFQHRLRDHVTHAQCRYVAPNAEEIKKYRESGEYFIFPLKEKGKRIGYLVFKEVEELEKEKVIILATQFALALRRVRLYKEIERVAITDGLTDVYTRRHTMERLQEEIRRSQMRKMEMAVLMIDVDHFKGINDNYGHLTGDQVLREISEIIKQNVREIDIAGRFGGEEFCIVLPDTGLEGAQYVAERIRTTTQAADIKAYDAIVNVTLSIGIAIYPKDAKKLDELIDKSDWSLYKAKKRGRNRVCAFGIDKG